MWNESNNWLGKTFGLDGHGKSIVIMSNFVQALNVGIAYTTNLWNYLYTYKKIILIISTKEHTFGHKKGEYWTYKLGSCLNIPKLLMLVCMLILTRVIGLVALYAPSNFSENS